MLKEYNLPQASLVFTSKDDLIFTFIEKYIVQHRLHKKNYSKRKINLEINLKDNPEKTIPQGSSLIRDLYKILVYKKDSKLYFKFKDSPAVAILEIDQNNLCKKNVEIFLHLKTLDYKMLLAFHFFFPILEYILLSDGIFPLHAAAFAHDNSAGILFAPSGGGKTTISLALNKTGIQILSEDRPLIMQDNNKVKILPSFGGPKISTETLSFFNIDKIKLKPSQKFEEKFVFQFKDMFEGNYEDPILVKFGAIFSRNNSNELKSEDVNKTLFLEHLLNFETFVIQPDFIPNIIAKKQLNTLLLMVEQIQTLRISIPNNSLENSTKLIKDIFVQIDRDER